MRRSQGKDRCLLLRHSQAGGDQAGWSGPTAAVDTWEGWGQRRAEEGTAEEEQSVEEGATGGGEEGVML